MSKLVKHAWCSIAVGSLAVLGVPAAQAVPVAGSVPAAPSSASATVHFVVDVSGSMAGTPLVQAKDALRQANSALSTQWVGLRAFSGACGTGGQLVIPVGPRDPATFDQKVNALVAGGGTPTPDALRAAVADLPASGDRSIVLVSDGQSTCGDPCAVAKGLKANTGVNFTVHTVGFKAAAGAANELQCIAQATGGSYHDVNDAAGLVTAIQEAVNPCPDVAFFGLRGSGQTAEESEGYGRQIGFVKGAVKSTLDRQKTSASYRSIHYSSAPMSDLVGDVFSPIIGWPLVKKAYFEATTMYAESMWGGSEKLSAAVGDYEAACRKVGKQPGKLILAGYSQGAAATNWIARSFSADRLQRTALVLVGDPLRDSGDKPQVTLGSAKPSKGILQLLPNDTFSKLTKAVAARTVSLCNAGDVVCDTKDALLFNDLRTMGAQHRNYPSDLLAKAGLAAVGLVKG